MPIIPGTPTESYLRVLKSKNLPEVVLETLGEEALHTLLKELRHVASHPAISLRTHVRILTWMVGQSAVRHRSPGNLSLYMTALDKRAKDSLLLPRRSSSFGFPADLYDLRGRIMEARLYMENHFEDSPF